MKKIMYIPGRGKRSSSLNHIATKCGRCDGYVGEIGGDKPKQEYEIRPQAKKR
jgi:hypothetical protein